MCGAVIHMSKGNAKIDEISQTINLNLNSIIYLHPGAQMGVSQFEPVQPCAQSHAPGLLHDPPLVNAQPLRHTGMLH